MQFTTRLQADPNPDAPAKPAVTIAVEAEHFFKQSRAEVRRWRVTAKGRKLKDVSPDGDPPHLEDASGEAYVEALPDTRRTHGDPLKPGQNFTNEPGQMAVLDYRVRFPQPGRYYVWVRAYSTGTEDNGIHVGIDGQWPSTGARMQWCEGKNRWQWESKQRTAKQHCGEPHKIYLDIRKPGRHVVSFSMREDGFEFDKFLLTTDRGFKRPDGPGPKAQKGKIARR